MISLEHVTFTYPSASSPALTDLTLSVREGEFVLVAGASGSGKSTLLRVLPRLVPHHSGGRFSGRVTIDGRDVTLAAPRELAGAVGFVPQDPEAHATADRVVPELAFAMENLGVPQAQMRKRVEEVIDQLGIAHLRDRRLDTLSGGERQRVAIAAVLTALPRVLVLDEPTSALDPQSAEDVFAVLVRLRDELGLTIVCAEHRLERVAAFSDSVVFFGEELSVGSPREVFASSPYAPPVSMLGRAFGWSPLPLTVREGRSFASSLQVAPPAVRPRTAGDVAMRCNGIEVPNVLRGVSLELRRGEIAALVGRNGAGKTTLMRVLAGIQKASRGSVDGVRRGRAAFVPQRAEMLLFRDRVRDEVRSPEWLARLGLSGVADRHPWTLSAGQRLWTALATAFTRDVDVLLLDEPTRGLDPVGKDLLASVLREKADAGVAVLLVTHDVELVARAADRIHMLAEGEIVASGPVREVLGESLLFSSQTSKVMADPRFLVPSDVTG